jgi:hypothetical protein
MFGQLCVEPEPELELPEPDEPDEPDDPELVLPELDDGVVVDELVLALEPVEPVLDELVVAALATSAPPVTRPVVSAPIANTFRKRIFIGFCPFG